MDSAQEFQVHHGSISPNKLCIDVMDMIFIGRYGSINYIDVMDHMIDV
jgi:hypothetical protein